MLGMLNTFTNMNEGETMKDEHLVLGMALLAIVAIVACFIGYATDTLPIQTREAPSQQTQVKTSSAGIPTADTVAASTRKSCNCCTERTKRAREQFRKIRERRQAKQQTEQTVVSQ